VSSWRWLCVVWVAGCGVEVTFDPEKKYDDAPVEAPDYFVSEGACDEGTDMDEDGVPCEDDDDDDGDEVPDEDDSAPCDPEVS
jgi:hypothetical protein